MTTNAPSLAPNGSTPIIGKSGGFRKTLSFGLTCLVYYATELFCRRNFNLKSDPLGKTFGQMIGAARSAKQNIVEGSEDGKTSTEMELKMLNVARASLGELREDYEDYLKSHSLPFWDAKHPRFDAMLTYCRGHNDYADYAALVEKMTEEEICNMAITLCRITDKMMVSYLEHLEKQFVTEGGIKERMHSARTGFRQEQDARLTALEQENHRLKSLLRQHGIDY